MDFPTIIFISDIFLTIKFVVRRRLNVTCATGWIPDAERKRERESERWFAFSAKKSF